MNFLRPCLSRYCARRRAGVTLVELMVAMAIMSIGILGMVGAFRYLNIGIQAAKTRSLANNIAQERIEFIKNKSYYRVLVTTATLTDNNFDPPMVYDEAPNGSETVNVGGINFTRRVYVRKVNEKPDGDLEYLLWSEPDPGLKEIKVYVVWFERGEWRKLELRNLRENPERTNQSATISGNVTDAADWLPIEGVVVKAQEGPSNYGETDASGDYSFVIEPGSYTLLATKAGYFPNTLPRFYIGPDGSETGKDLTLTKMSSGTITGTLYRRDHMVIAMVVASTAMVNGENIEFVSLYNATTAQIDMLSGTDNNINLSYYGETGLGHDVSEFELDYISTYVPSGYYFLIASSGSFTFDSIAMTADAVFSPSNSPPCADLGGGILNCIRRDKAGAIRIRDINDNIIDTLGWTNSATARAAPYYEGTAKTMNIGLADGYQIYRFIGPWTIGENTSACFDTNINSQNFYSYPWPYAVQPYRAMNLASGYRDPTRCTPAAGALVFADDSLSSPVTANSAGAFSLVSVATGTTWTVFASSGVVFSSFTANAGTADGFTTALGSSLVISSETPYGYVTGRVADMAGGSLSGIQMFSAGMSEVTTGADGRYTLPVIAGVLNVTANHSGQSASYVELSSADISVGIGEIVKDVDFSLYNGGKISGRITSNGTDPLPNIPVVGLKEGVEQGSGISDADGYFLLAGSGISTGTYVVEPQLEIGESATPSSMTVVVEAGLTTFSSTFTVSGASGYFTGTMRTGSSSGPAITTGVLIYITTATIVSTPPTINSALRGSTGVYYGGSSNARGEYSIAVKGGYSYNVYAWYTTWSGSVPTTTMKSSEGVSINPNETKTEDFFW